MDISSSRVFIRALKAHPDNFNIIHYSCESLYDDNTGLSPRITSIAVNHFSSHQTVSFSTHAVAEELQIARDQVRDRFDEIELRLLTNFYDFIRDLRDKFWVHWNMRNLTYGFEHIQHRYRILARVDIPIIIPVERRINLNDMLADRYGSGYASHPKLQSLMDMNGGIHRDFLNGEQEIEAFQNNEFVRLHRSTLCKVGFFHSVMKKLIQGRLVTASKGWGVALDRLFESRFAKACGLAAALLALGLTAWQLLPPVVSFVVATAGASPP